jgi:hypothetical protein
MQPDVQCYGNVRESVNEQHESPVSTARQKLEDRFRQDFAARAGHTEQPIHGGIEPASAVDWRK